MGTLHENLRTFMITSCREMLQTKVTEKIKTHILSPTTFFKKSCCLCDMEKYCKVRQATDNIMTCTACWIPNVTNTHYLYSTATNIAHTCLNVMVYVHCLSCFIFRSHMIYLEDTVPL
jgi:hypothetical protein